MANGVIARLVREKGFGFIKVEGSHTEEDVFFHRSALGNVEFERLTEGQAVTFTLGQGPKGSRAEDVHVL